MKPIGFRWSINSAWAKLQKISELNQLTFPLCFRVCVHAVDGNQKSGINSPVEGKVGYIPFVTGFCASQVVHDFFHHQYVSKRHLGVGSFLHNTPISQSHSIAPFLGRTKSSASQPTVFECTRLVGNYPGTVHCLVPVPQKYWSFHLFSAFGAPNFQCSGNNREKLWKQIWNK